MNDIPAAPRTRLFTAFGTMVYVDAVSGLLRHDAFDDSRANAVLVADPRVTQGPQTASLMYDAGGVLEAIVVSSEGCWRASSTKPSPESISPLRVIQIERGLVALHSGGLFFAPRRMGGSHSRGPSATHGNVSWRRRTGATH